MLLFWTIKASAIMSLSLNVQNHSEKKSTDTWHWLDQMIDTRLWNDDGTIVLANCCSNCALSYTLVDKSGWMCIDVPTNSAVLFSIFFCLQYYLCFCIAINSLDSVFSMNFLYPQHHVPQSVRTKSDEDSTLTFWAVNWRGFFTCFGKKKVKFHSQIKTNSNNSYNCSIHKR